MLTSPEVYCRSLFSTDSHKICFDLVFLLHPILPPAARFAQWFLGKIAALHKSIKLLRSRGTFKKKNVLLTETQHCLFPKKISAFCYVFADVDSTWGLSSVSVSWSWCPTSTVPVSSESQVLTLTVATVSISRRFLWRNKGSTGLVLSA